MDSGRPVPVTPDTPATPPESVSESSCTPSTGPSPCPLTLSGSRNTSGTYVRAEARQGSSFDRTRYTDTFRPRPGKGTVSGGSRPIDPCSTTGVRTEGPSTDPRVDRQELRDGVEVITGSLRRGESCSVCGVVRPESTVSPGRSVRTPGCVVRVVPLVPTTWGRDKSVRVGESLGRRSTTRTGGGT